MESAYLEYSLETSRLARLFKFSVKRGLLTDIGKNGVQFRAADDLKEGDTLIISLRLPGAKGPTRLKAEVRWTREEFWSGIETYSHVVGAEFTELSSKAWTVLQEAVR